MVNGQWQPYARNSRHEAERAARLLSRATAFNVPVMGVIVTVWAKEVTVTNRRWTSRWSSGSDSRDGSAVDRHG